MNSSNLSHNHLILTTMQQERFGGITLEKKKECLVQNDTVMSFGVCNNSQARAQGGRLLQKHAKFEGVKYYYY